jgi:TPR repeat protein
MGSSYCTAGSQYNIALCYHKGIGATQNYEEALRYYKLANARHSILVGPCLLGVLMFKR